MITETAAATAIWGALTSIERHYVEALNAVLATPGCEDNADVDRWRGHAEAYRTVAEDLRRRFSMGAVNYGSSEWRDKHGVYTKAQIASFRRSTT